MSKDFTHMPLCLVLVCLWEGELVHGVMVSNCLHFSVIKRFFYGELYPIFVSFLYLPFSYLFLGNCCCLSLYFFCLLSPFTACYYWTTLPVSVQSQGWWRVSPSLSPGMHWSPLPQWKNLSTGCSSTNTSRAACVMLLPGQISCSFITSWV